MKKFLLRLLLALILLPVVAIAWEYGKSIYYRDQFRFEHFDVWDEHLFHNDTAKALLLHLRAHFPYGSNAEELLKVLEKAGAQCFEIDKNQFTEHNLKKCTRIVHCEYTSGWFSSPALTTYEVQTCISDTNKIIRVNARVGYWGP